MANLQEVLDAQPNVIDFLRNQQAGPNVYPGVPAEYTNWRNEQRAWAKTAVLFNQSYHMVELLVEGPGAFAMLEALGINAMFVGNNLMDYLVHAPSEDAVRRLEPDLRALKAVKARGEA